MKYFISIAVSLGLFLVFRRDHHFTLQTWVYLLAMHAPVVGLMLAFEKNRKITIHPVACFACIWLGGLALGYLVGPIVIATLRSNA